jgi:dTDP-4-amino-4,6-dideoxygalactose transaminase
VAPVPELERFGLPILEDAAQAAGADLSGRRAGSLGTAATYSFFPSKNLPCLGDGGAIVTNDGELAERARRLRFHGSEDKVTYTEVGYNSRLDELQAGVLRLLLPELDGWNDSRRHAADRYLEEGLGELLSTPVAVDGARHVYHLYVARHERADELQAALGEAGISTRGYYRTPVHRQPSMERWGAGAELPATDEVARTNLALPMGTGLADEQIAAVVEACRRALA